MKRFRKGDAIKHSSLYEMFRRASRSKNKNRFKSETHKKKTLTSGFAFIRCWRPHQHHLR